MRVNAWNLCGLLVLAIPTVFCVGMLANYLELESPSRAIFGALCGWIVCDIYQMFLPIFEDKP